jgi:tetrahydrodipicolinate N-succinyltransferase
VSILEDLDAGIVRAAHPDPAAPGGWRVDSDIQQAILLQFADRETRTWDLAGAMQFRDRVGLPIKDLLNSPEAVAALANGKPWRIVPGGSSVRAGAVVAPGVRQVAGPFAAANGLALSAAIIVKYRDERTDARVALEEALR